jgi:hypothetical protein
MYTKSLLSLTVYELQLFAPQTMPPKAAEPVKKAIASVPSYAELLSSNRSSKSKLSVSTEKKKKGDKAPEFTSDVTPPTASIMGCRVVLSSSGIFGTVRYVGPTTFQEGAWVGVELDTEQVPRCDNSFMRRSLTC